MKPGVTVVELNPTFDDMLEDYLFYYFVSVQKSCYWRGHQTAL
jgi:hypothetical protein